MRTVSVNTSNNVAIDYDLASLQQRILAFGVDLMILVAWYVFIIVVSMDMSYTENNRVLLLVLMLPAMIYTLIFEAFFNGQTLGKRSMGIKVVKLDGRPISFAEAFQRWVFRLLEIWFTLGSVASLFISSSTRGQRIGDILAQTIVINTHPRHALKVVDLLSMEEKKDGEKRLTGVLRYTDDDMLLVKAVLDRYKKYQNPAHEAAVRELATRIAEQIDLPREKVKDDIGFLRKVLQDYIVLTRS
jgi:uncharacterized RDD family membrane protein YckC